jgi:hypothetical protein
MKANNERSTRRESLRCFSLVLLHFVRDIIVEVSSSLEEKSEKKRGFVLKKRGRKRHDTKRIS